ncbi:hypothetical protein EJ03DRAFT_269204 [Teratosphaeria nubilosa]|uniref:BZIP domain-containing protein n=1 Tax=Teratosphaeria nubilosa TaxID=161662 RepID=A0A6G1LDZ3_9PEZI|nr:hypothetical protein EJ03DRAFT_269204 [Teratosphaeria nubilosa]
MSGAPPLPTPPALARHGYGFGPTPSAEAARRANSGANLSGITSASASPTTSYSSYSQAEQTSPSAQYGPLSSLNTAPPTGPDNSNTSDAPGSNTGQGRGRPAIPISSSSGQNVYQMMTLETTSGTVQLPVDVQAASRVADEKRRRNAGASARFRQRRKEKEKEASVTISRLEQQVKELSEDADFYKRERDYMAGLLVHLPGGERHFPRPQSPRRRRSSTTLQGSSGNVGVGTGFGNVAHDPSARSPQHTRPGRRRASTASLPPPPPAGAPQPGSYYQHAYASQQAGNPIAPQPGHGLQKAQGAMPSPMARSGLSHCSPLPSMQQQPGPSAPNLPQPLMQAPPQTGPWNPYAPDQRRPPGPLGRPDSSRVAGDRP